MIADSISSELCKKSNEEVLKMINPCSKCKLIPIPLLRDKHQLENVYCTKCASEAKINKQKATPEDKKLLEQLIIDCKNLCGQTFTYSNFTTEYSDHIIKCNLIRSSKDSCFRCQKHLGKETDNHDCLLTTNIRITNVESSLHERLTFLEENQKKFKDEIIQVLNQKATNSEDNEKLRNLIDEYQKEKREREEKDRINKEFNDSIKVSFDSFSSDINEKLRESKIHQPNFNQINDNLANLIQQQKLLEDKLKNDIEKLENKINFIAKKSDCISELHSKFEKALSYYKSSNDFKSLIESDSMKPINVESFPIESLKLIDDYQKFNDQYDSINTNLENELRKYSDNKGLYGNISNVIETAHEHWISCMVISKNKLISSSYDGSIKIWNLKTNSLEKEIVKAHDGECVYALMLLPQECLFISGGEDSNIRFWDDQYNQINLIKNESPILSMLERNNILIVAGGSIPVYGTSYSINFYDLSTKMLINKINTDHKDRIWRILLLNSTNNLLTGSYDSTIKVWNINNYSIKNSLNNVKSLSTIDEHKGIVRSLIQLKYDSNVIVSCDNFGTIVFYKINENYNILAKYKLTHYDQESSNGSHHSMSVHELLKYKMLVSVTSNSSLLFWSLTDYQVLRNVRFDESHFFSIGGFDDDEGIFFSQGNNNIVIWK